MQDTLVLLIVAAAAAHVGWVVWSGFVKGQVTGCAGCHACPANGKTLVQLGSGLED
jgi:hypothetical protein